MYNNKNIYNNKNNNKNIYNNKNNNKNNKKIFNIEIIYNNKIYKL